MAENAEWGHWLNPGASQNGVILKDRVVFLVLEHNERERQGKRGLLLKEKNVCVCETLISSEVSLVLSNHTMIPLAQGLMALQHVNIYCS